MASEEARRTKILIAIPTLSAGGTERVVTTLANQWSQSGRNVVIATFEPAAAETFYPLDDAVRLLKLDLPPVSKPKWRAIAHTFKRIRTLKRAIRAERPDVVISFLTKMNVMTALAADGLGVPVIISERNNPYVQSFDRFWDTARGFAFPKAFAFVTMTQGAADFFPKRQRRHTRIIPNPVSVPSHQRSASAGKTLTAVGRLTAQKRFDRLIEAFARIEADFPDWSLVIWGEGELRAELEALGQKLGLGPRVLLPGLTAKPGGWLETADILALSSDYEGWPNVVIEALAGGVPVVAGDCEFGVKEILRDGALGLIAPKDDNAAFAAALARMMRDENLRRDLSAKGREAAKQYSPEAIAGKWDALIAEAIAAKR
jgi:glycosyltransferase involved in cell wall biosynthesis